MKETFTESYPGNSFAFCVGGGSGTVTKKVFKGMKIRSVSIPRVLYSRG